MGKELKNLFLRIVINQPLSCNGVLVPKHSFNSYDTKVELDDCPHLPVLGPCIPYYNLTAYKYNTGKFTPAKSSVFLPPDK
jgi:hypothetical protein